ncbi:MAG: polysaccharide deacetylase family protein [Bacteroidetes bacterium]|nr:polysaccharide deacetylase family protein [Bacteroidota bacterium]MBL6944714.1 polysaccharide deacetylase family protein [Bacteroidales bacterium]
MNDKVNITTIIIVMLILTGSYFNFTSLYYLIPVVLTYVIINAVGSSRIQLNYFFPSYCNATTTKKEIALTFDDGPHPVITPKLIELLDSYNTPATFFCTGKNAVANPKIVTTIINKGHLIGNHSYGHSRFFDLFSSKNMQKEILDTNEVITTITGKTPRLFRPPYGVTNPMLSKALIKTNMVSVGWSLRSYDTVKSSKKVMAKLTDDTKAGDIVLFHDTNPNVITIIEDYLFWLQKNDFKIVSLTSLLNIPAYED